ncbi:MAG: glycosyltransferase [Prolixibacteraceae bacterium]|nr:glycosyltransferase [Prolixibacteraceae bacterium]
MNTERPLVSIIVITYNSAKFVLETLESARAQTYQNIELIVSDDGSTDETVNICNQWIEQNKERFVRTELITANENTGIPANCNRGVNAAKGEWMKLIAGDDILVNSAIQEAVQFFSGNADIKIFDSRVEVYNENMSVKIGDYDINKDLFYYNGISAAEQLGLFVKRLDGRRIISTLGVFASRKLIENIGGFDVKYKLLEDAPLWFKIMKSGIKFHYLDKVTVLYRRHENAISKQPTNHDTNEKILSDFKLTVDQFMWDHFYERCDFLQKVNLIWMRGLSKIVICLGNKGIIAQLLYRCGRSLQPRRLHGLRRRYRELFKSI